MKIEQSMTITFEPPHCQTLKPLEKYSCLKEARIAASDHCKQAAYALAKVAHQRHDDALIDAPKTFGETLVDIETAKYMYWYQCTRELAMRVEKTWREDEQTSPKRTR